MEIVEVKQNWPKDTIRIDVSLGNYCNYKCWYCWPGSNEGTYKFPDFDLIVKNLSALLDYYLANSDKRKFDFNLLGGEATLWPKFIDFVAHFKKNYDCVFTITTNGSRKIEWWKEAAPYLDYVVISSHHQFADVSHLRDLADFLYNQKMIVVITQVMDPYNWDKCLQMIDYYKKSRHSWAIRYTEIIDSSVNYNDEQKKLLSKVRARRANLFWFLKNNKSYRSRVEVIDADNKKHKMSDNDILLKRLNNFKGWECVAGIDWLAVKMDGRISAICSNQILGQDYNLFDLDFVEKFKPIIKPTICAQEACWCSFETNMNKRKIIPIKNV